MSKKKEFEIEDYIIFTIWAFVQKGTYNKAKIILKHYRDYRNVKTD